LSCCRTRRVSAASKTKQHTLPGVKIKLRGDAGFALPLLDRFREFLAIEYALGIPANRVFHRRAEPRRQQLERRYCDTQLPQRSFSSFRHRARSWSRLRRICYKAEHTAAGTNLRFHLAKFFAVIASNLSV
jgi:hypothetical protein